MGGVGDRDLENERLEGAPFELPEDKIERAFEKGSDLGEGEVFPFFIGIVENHVWA